MTLVTLNKTGVAYDNFVNPTDVTSMVTADITGFVSGFPVANLEYQDPWTMAKTAGTSTSPSIEHRFSGAVPVEAIGIINHNLGEALYTQVEVESWTSPAGPYVQQALYNIPTTVDNDIIIPITQVSSERWRLTFTTGGFDFYIGSIFYGRLKTLETNPINDGFVQSRSTSATFEESAGGATHATFGATKRSSILDITWRRADMAMITWFNGRPNDELLGFIGPEQGDMDDNTNRYDGANLFWGYKVDDVTSPVGPGQMATSQKATYNYTMHLRGAV